MCGSLILKVGVCAAVLCKGDNVRFGLNKDLGFSPQDRTENIRRIAEVPHPSPPPPNSSFPN
jgi:adenylylsulfate kinase-like enzyme